MRENLQGGCADLECNGGNRHFASRFFSLGRKAGTQLLKLRDIRTVVLGDVRNCVPSFRKMLGSLAAYSAHRDAFDLSPLGEIRQRRLNKVSGTSCRGDGRRESRFGVGLHIIFTDTSTRTGTFHFVNVHP